MSDMVQNLPASQDVSKAIILVTKESCSVSCNQGEEKEKGQIVPSSLTPLTSCAPPASVRPSVRPSVQKVEYRSHGNTRAPPAPSL